MIVGTWNATASTFTPGGTAPNAVRIHGRRSAATGNAIPLILGQLVGRPSHDILASATTRGAAGSGMEIFGINKLSGGSPTQRVSGNVEVGSNGSWDGPSGTLIVGNIHYRGSVPNGVQVSGTRTQMPSNKSFTNVSAPSGSTNHQDMSLSSTTYNIGPGNHRIDNLSIGGNGTLAINANNGDVRIYVTKNLSISGEGRITVSGSNRVEFYMASEDAVSLSGNGIGRGALYANRSDFKASGDAYWQGTVIARTIDLSSTGRVIADPSFPVAASFASLMGGSGAVSGTIATVN